MIVLALLASALVLAQDEPLFEPLVYPAGAGVRGSAPADVDEDGWPDLVVWTFGPGVMLNLEGQGFAAPYGVAGAGEAVQAVDLDEDGHLDLVAVNDGPDTVSVSLGNGDGTFASFITYPAAADLRDVAVADFDGDGDLDLATPGLNALRVSILLGNGDGSFGPEEEYGPVGDYASAIAAGDLDGDDVLDLAVASGNDAQVSLLFGNGDGSFGGAEAVPMPGGVDDVVPTDLDDDGDLDLVVSMVTGSEVRALFNDGGGSFDDPGSEFPLPSSVNSPLVVRDFDEDGRNDVAVGVGASDLAYVFHATGLTGHGTLEFVGAYVTGDNPQGLSCADLDLDGDLDLVSTNFNSDDVRVLRGEGDGSFGTAASAWASGVSPFGIAAGDLDEDGLMDIVTSGTGAALSILLNAGNGRFPTATSWAVPSGTRHDVLVDDFNGDGHADVVTADQGAGALGGTLVLGAGNGLPLQVKDIPPNLGWSWVDAADFDEDGDLDLVFTPTGFATSLSVQVSFNDGAGNFTAGPLLDTEFFVSTGVCAADYNGDDNPDIATTHDTFPGRITVFLGDGDGAFFGPVTTESYGGHRDIVAADFDDDGDMDVALTSYYGQFVVHMGNGDGTFAPWTEYGFLPNAYGLEVADLDHDGIEDLVTANNQQFAEFGSLSVLIGQGDGTFEAPVTFRTGQNPWQVAVADLDGDGWNDLATAPFQGNDVLKNRRGPWNELAQGLAGTEGIPRQTGEGTLLPGEPFRFTLRDARPFSTAYHVVGAAQLLLPFKGGVMVPTLDFINPFPVTDLDGEVVLQGPWIGAPTGLTLYFQFWIPDPEGIKNFAASTAVSATMP